ncbi:unnamed protein product [Didymodactylos carnosus]|uniref:Uncharacterized protein n=1 Tax=Didymodactylos carnosus TaxID=1234261 RepID=A0A814DL41_9BILA|nr:unnamed protein product [Didymodactylos carnosus]CAF1275058.1 unnamed protein product [Didymodactylos carnosus]CAF3732082.1 unnamed protein product [Didymodactylos carnosus]CAF4080210.1 unnamed protein product [Didymodactylos carnosus]
MNLTKRTILNIWWYTREGFLYRLLNKALRQQDHCEKLKEIEWNVQVYCGQLMSKEEINILKENTHYLLAINSFLSASVDRDLALIFSGSPSNSLDEDVQSVLFQISLDKLEFDKPFADITRKSFNEDEKEVIFAPGVFFCTHEVKYDEKNKVWVIDFEPMELNSDINLI